MKAKGSGVKKKRQKLKAKERVDEECNVGKLRQSRGCDRELT